MNHINVLKLANWGIWILVAILLYNLVLFVWPREIVTVTIETDKTVYTSKDKIILTTSTVEGKATASSEYVSSIDCKEFRIRVGEFGANTVSGPPRTSSVEIAIPENIPYDTTCFIELVGSHEVDIAPFLEKTYTTQWVSNEFVIKE